MVSEEEKRRISEWQVEQIRRRREQQEKKK